MNIKNLDEYKIYIGPDTTKGINPNKKDPLKSLISLSLSEELQTVPRIEYLGVTTSSTPNKPTFQ